MNFYPVCACIGGNGELLIAHINKLLGIIIATSSLHFVPYPWESTIATKNQIKIVLLPFTFFGFPGKNLCFGQINIPNLFIKTELRTGLFGQVDHPFVQYPSGNGPNGLPFLSVLLKVNRFVIHMHCPFVQRNGNILNSVTDTNLIQGTPSPIAHGKVNGSSWKLNGSNIRSSIEHGHRVTNSS